jgi:hypothetical protein
MKDPIGEIFLFAPANEVRALWLRRPPVMLGPMTRTGSKS